MDLVSIGLGVLVLATLVAAFLASKHWHWAHVLVVVGLVFASVGYLFLITPAIKTRVKWQKQYADAEAGLEKTLPQIEALRWGTDNGNVILELRSGGLELNAAADEIEGVVSLQERFRINSRLRGRQWSDAEVLGIDGQTGEARLVIESPNPLGIEEGALLFAFEQGTPSPNTPEQGAQYLGEFRVVGLNDQEVTLAPVLQLGGREMNRLAGSRGPWILHETMPVDDPSLFAGLSEDQLRGLVPEGAVEDYLRDGTPWTSDDGEQTKQGYDDEDIAVGPDDEDRAVRFVYRRELRDYSASFQELDRQQVELIADIQAIEQDNAKLAAALKGAQELNAYRKEAGRKLRHDLAGAEQELAAIEAHLAALQRQVGRAEELLAQTLSTNSVFAAELTAAQQAALGRDLTNDPAPSRRAVDVDAL